MKFFIIALQNLWRNRSFILINSSGLAIGIAVFVLMLYYVYDEKAYDSTHTKSDRIYRVLQFINKDGMGEESSSCPYPVASTLKEDYPEMIEEAIRFFNFQNYQFALRADSKNYNESRLYFTDTAITRIFDLKFLQGDPQKALSQPGSIVLTRSLADKYFDQEDPMGKPVIFEGKDTLLVGGIIEDWPRQSHLHPEAFISFNTVPKLTNYMKDNWIWNPCWTYILLKPGVSPADLEMHLPEFVDSHYHKFNREMIRHELQPIRDIHLQSDYAYEIEPNGNIQTTKALSLAAIIILIISCLNFINLATAQAGSRAKETGIRKTSGARTETLFFQFLTESAIAGILSGLMALVVTELSLSLFRQLCGKPLESCDLLAPPMLAAFLGTGLITGLLSGLYPAFFLSSFAPASMLKNNARLMVSNTLLRKALVVIQFSFVLGLVICSFTLNRQLKWLRAASLGFDKKDVLVIPVRSSMADAYLPFMKELKQNPLVTGVTASDDLIGKHHNIFEFQFDTFAKSLKEVIYYPALFIDEHFVPVMKLELIAGENINASYDECDPYIPLLVNEAMVRQRKWGSPEEAIGKQISFFMETPGRVVGIVRDFNQKSLTKPVQPFFLVSFIEKAKRDFTHYIYIKIPPDKHGQTMAAIKATWERQTDIFPFGAFFLDQALDSQYDPQEKLAQLAGILTLLSIVLACIGLLALIALTVAQRAKEIGIRKAVGAEALSVMYLFGKDFIGLILLANLIAWPVSWYLLQQWLSHFITKIEISGLVFATAAILTLFIAAVTVSIQTLRVALAAPVKSLRYE